MLYEKSYQLPLQKYLINMNLNIIFYINYLPKSDNNG